MIWDGVNISVFRMEHLTGGATGAHRFLSNVLRK
jgi:hypothetical protein